MKTKKITVSFFILISIIVLVSCMRKRDKRLHGCVYNIGTGEVIEKQRDFTLEETTTFAKVPVGGKYYNFNSTGFGCYDKLLELGKTDYRLVAHILPEESSSVALYNYSLSKIKYYELDMSKLSNPKNINAWSSVEFKLSNDNFKRKNKDIEINFGYLLFGKFRINLINSSGADSITVYAKNPFFEDIIFSNSGFGNKSSKEYRLTACPYTLRYEVIKNGITTTTTEEVEIEEAKLTSVTHNY